MHATFVTLWLQVVQPLANVHETKWTPHVKRQSDVAQSCKSSGRTEVISGSIIFNEAFLLYGLFIRIATPLSFFAMHSREIVALTTSGKRVSLYPLKMTPSPGYWDADHADREQ